MFNLRDKFLLYMRESSLFKINVHVLKNIFVTLRFLLQETIGENVLRVFCERMDLNPFYHNGSVQEVGSNIVKYMF